MAEAGNCRALTESANPAPNFTIPAGRIIPHQLQIIPQIHLRPLELRQLPLNRHPHALNPPARRRRRGRRIRSHRENGVVPPAQAIELRVPSRIVIHEIGGAIEERVAPSVSAAEWRAGSREIEDPTRQARVRIVDEDRLRGVVYVVHHEGAGVR